MFTVPGIIVAGMHVAQNTLTFQWEHLTKHLPEISDAHIGTINVQSRAALLLINPDVTVPAIAWHPDHPNLAESFSFIRIGFECPMGQPPKKGWIYMSHQSPRRYDLTLVEVITSKITGVAPDVPCCLHFERVAGFII